MSDGKSGLQLRSLLKKSGELELSLVNIPTPEPADDEVVVRVEYSDINYKDALAATGAGRILRKYPLVGGIDLAGVVVGSSDPRYAAGQRVLVLEET